MPQSKSDSSTGAIVIMLLSGTVVAIANKVLYQMSGTGLSSCQTVNTKFEKPYFLTLCMFIGEAMCLPMYYYLQYRKKKSKLKRQQESLTGSTSITTLTVDSNINTPNHRDFTGSNFSNDTQLSSPLLSDDRSSISESTTSSETGTTRPPKWVFLLLSIFDLSATSLNGVGLLWITASANQMLRGSTVVFVALFSILILRAHINLKQWFGVVIVTIGLAMVGVSSSVRAHFTPAIEPDSTDSMDATTAQQLLGVALILAGSALNSIQNVLEEKLLKAIGGEVHPMEVVGWEGVFGTLCSGLILLPIAQYLHGEDCGSQENTLDTLIQIKNNWMVVLLLLSYIFGLSIMNFYSMEISRVLSAVYRNLVSTARTVLVWLVSVSLYYLVTNTYGENVDIYSLIQLFGFVCLIAGTLTYGKAKEVVTITTTETDIEDGNNIITTKIMQREILADDSLAYAHLNAQDHINAHVHKKIHHHHHHNHQSNSSHSHNHRNGNGLAPSSRNPFAQD